VVLVHSFRPYSLRIFAGLTALLLLLMAPACKRTAIAKHEYMYVSAPETSLRDRVATMYNKVGTVHSGDRVDVLEKAKRFVRVRTDSGVEGWVEQRSLVTQDVFDGFQKLAQDATDAAVQGHGTTRADLNMHLTPSRDGEHLYQLKEGEKVEILRRATTNKNAPKPPPPKPAATNAKAQETGKPQPATSSPTPTTTTTATTPATSPATSSPAKTAVSGGKSADNTKEAEPPKPVMEDWYLVRSSSGKVGWVLLRMIDLDVPLDVAQYAEGQRIVGYFVLNTVQENIDGEEKQEPQYLVLLNMPKDGLAWDYNQIRVFTRNRNKHRYETAYRERDMEGYLPVKTGHAVFEKEGDLPTFTIRKMNADGQIVESTYKMNGPIVRRVLSPEEVAEQKSRHDAELAARRKAKADARAQRTAAHQKKPKKKTQQ
jgi:1,2-phenylacetyl-CoA epoxidase PaaB subunit